MADQEEFSIIVRDGVQLQGREWLVETPRAAVFMVHGLGEHSGRYDQVAERFNENDFSFFCADLRGHGYSEGKRGHARSLERLCDDLEECLMYVRSEYNDLPLFVYGHSLGGLITLSYLLSKNTNELQAAVVSSPWLRTKNEPSGLEIKAAKWLSGLLPSFTQSNRLNTSDLTRDSEVNNAYKNDPLVHDRISVRLFTECYHGGIWARQNAERLKLPVYLFHGSDDNITDFQASIDFARLAGDWVDFKLWEGNSHEPHNDLDKIAVLESVISWMDDKLS